MDADVDSVVTIEVPVTHPSESPHSQPVSERLLALEALIAESKLSTILWVFVAGTSRCPPGGV